MNQILYPILSGSYHPTEIPDDHAVKRAFLEPGQRSCPRHPKRMPVASVPSDLPSSFRGEVVVGLDSGRGGAVEEPLRFYFRSLVWVCVFQDADDSIQLHRTFVRAKAE